MAGTMTLTRLLVAIANLEGDTALHDATLQRCPNNVADPRLGRSPSGSRRERCRRPRPYFAIGRLIESLMQRKINAAYDIRRRSR
jgi:hypothetical protein